MKIGKLLSKSRVKGMPRENFDDFYHLLKIIIENTNLKDELLLLAKVIFNCDDTGISLRPRQVKFIIPRGQRTSNYTSDLDRLTYRPFDLT